MKNKMSPAALAGFRDYMLQCFDLNGTEVTTDNVFKFYHELYGKSLPKKYRSNEYSAFLKLMYNVGYKELKNTYAATEAMI